MQDTFYTDKIELAWAAGLFDGEGSITLHNTNAKRPKDYVTPCMQMSQSGSDIVVVRFHQAVLGLGKIYGPYQSPSIVAMNGKPKWMWKCQTATEVLQVIPLLWNYLSQPKQDQIYKVMIPYLVDKYSRRPYRKG